MFFLAGFAGILAAQLSAAGSTAVAPSGLYFEQTTRVGSDGGSASPGVRSRVWCQGPRMRLEPADATGPALVLWLDSGRVFRLDPEGRLATELDAERLRGRSEMDASIAGGLMGGAGEDELRTVRLPGLRTLAGHTCRGYRITGSMLTVDTWVARDLGVNADVFADFLDWSGATLSLGGLVKAIRALPGFPLETRMRLSILGTVRETTSTVTVVRRLAVPEGRFQVPAGWRLLSEKPAEGSQ